MLVKEILERVESSEEFKVWKKTDYYLAYMFASSKDDWQVGYYNKNGDNMTTFQVSEAVSKLPESEVFKEKKTVKELDLEKVKVDFEEAVNKCVEEHSKLHPMGVVSKQIIILQHLKQGQVWNVTFLTTTMNTTNIKLDSSTGKIISKETFSLGDLLKVDKGNIPMAK